MGSCAYMNAHIWEEAACVLHQVMEKGVGRPSRHEVAREASMVFLLYLPFIICCFSFAVRLKSLFQACQWTMDSGQDKREVGVGDLAQDVASRAVKRTRGHFCFSCWVIFPRFRPHSIRLKQLHANVLLRDKHGHEHEHEASVELEHERRLKCHGYKSHGWWWLRWHKHNE